MIKEVLKKNTFQGTGDIAINILALRKRTGVYAGTGCTCRQQGYYDNADNSLERTTNGKLLREKLVLAKKLDAEGGRQSAA